MTTMNGHSDEFDGPDPQTNRNLPAVIGSGIASLSLTAALFFGSPMVAYASETTMPSVTNGKTCTIVEIVDENENEKSSESGTDMAMNTDGGAASDCMEKKEGEVQQAAVSVAENDKASAEVPEESTDEATVLAKATEESSEPESVAEEPIVEEEKLMAAASSEQSDPEVVPVSAESEQTNEDSAQTSEEHEQEPQFVDAPAQSEESSEEISGEDTNMIASSDVVEAPSSSSSSEEVKDEAHVEAKDQEDETDGDTD